MNNFTIKRYVNGKTKYLCRMTCKLMYFSEDAAKAIYLTEDACGYWLRTVCRNMHGTFNVVSSEQVQKECRDSDMKDVMHKLEAKL